VQDGAADRTPSNFSRRIGFAAAQPVAEMVDLNIRSIQKIEADRMNVLVTTAMRIQKALKCAWKKLLG
jgi:DNA-binding XRE family transcriptional regulator